MVAAAGTYAGHPEAAPRRELFLSLHACASCGAREGLLPEDGAGIVFCQECATPASEVLFAEYYLDIGVVD